MRIELLSATDALVYRALMLEGFLQAPDAFTSSFEERASLPDSFWIDRLSSASGASAVLGMLDNEKLVGTCALLYSTGTKTRHKGRLAAMYVLPDYRKRGVAKSLLDRALNLARERDGLTMLTLTVTRGNSAAEALYRAAGFVEFGVEPMAVRGSAGYLSKIHMWQSLVAE